MQNVGALCNFLRVTILVLKIWRWLLYFWKMCGPLSLYAVTVADTMNQKGTDAPELLRCTFPLFQNF